MINLVQIRDLNRTDFINLELFINELDKFDRLADAVQDADEKPYPHLTQEDELRKKCVIW